MEVAIEKVFLELLGDNKAQISRICSVYSRDEDEKKDLFQGVAFNLWKSLPSFKGNSALSTWVYRVTLNTCMQARFKVNRHESAHVKLKSIHFELIMQSDDDAAKQERIALLYTCIRKLNDADKNLVMLFLEDLPYKEIAFITGATENHVAVRLKRVREKLFNCLK
ncbi:MAG TPA: sigma-70 family RNA polymerase sigma factor [Cyclobacteriaceae bacterium]|nr:sigma-70 family RNA polymerase sigma factor [Cyclobacteriaceae bacterium]HRJ81299.1 sigma-70 family RNA polymerase sigma factor [Cyclobacteriaceae bacterium]